MCLYCPFLCCLQVMVTPYNEIDKNEYIDPRTAQVAIVDHVKQVSLAVSMSI